MASFCYRSRLRADRHERASKHGAGNMSQINSKFNCYALQCRDGFAGDGEECELDPDLDAIPVKGLSCTSPNCKKVCL